jgi:hypothetical protein
MIQDYYYKPESELWVRVTISALAMSYGSELRITISSLAVS